MKVTAERDNLIAECSRLENDVNELAAKVRVSQEHRVILEQELTNALARDESRSVELLQRTSDVHSAWEVSDHLGAVVASQKREIDRLESELGTVRAECM